VVQCRQNLTFGSCIVGSPLSFESDLVAIGWAACVLPVDSGFRVPGFSASGREGFLDI